MKTFLDCIPCLVRQTLDSVRMLTDDVAVKERVLRQTLRGASEMDLRESPPVMAQRTHRLIRELTGDKDPYRQIKAQFTELALSVYSGLRARVEESEDPLATAVRLAIAGNVIDMGVDSHMKEEQVHLAIRNALAGPLHGDSASLDEAVSRSEAILYLADNAGEIVFDRLLIEQLGPTKVTVAVRGSAVLNDATITDAQAAGLDTLVDVIDNGSDAPGTILDDCSEAFLGRFDRADLVIAKGQGNYETLSEVRKDIFFALMAKCPIIASDLGCEVGDLVLRRSALAAAATRDKSHAGI